MLCSHLAVAADDELVGSQLAKAHRAAGVQLLRGDAHLRAEAEFKSVRKARRGVLVDAGGVDLAQKAPPPRPTLADERTPSARCLIVSPRDVPA